MHRLGHLVNGDWVEHSQPAVFESTGRVVAGVPGSDPDVFARLVECLEPPYHLLYVLHTPRGEGSPGRYQSPPLELSEVKAFLARFRPILSADGRYDLWAHSTGDQGTVVWDRHNFLFGYGPTHRFAHALRSLGFTSGRPSIPAPHTHNYHAALDHLARDLLTAMDWSHSPLRPEDEQ